MTNTLDICRMYGLYYPYRDHFISRLRRIPSWTNQDSIPNHVSQGSCCRCSNDLLLDKTCKNSLCQILNVWPIYLLYIYHKLWPNVGKYYIEHMGMPFWRGTKKIRPKFLYIGQPGSTAEPAVPVFRRREIWESCTVQQRWRFSRWWFQMLFIFAPTWGDDPIWLSYLFSWWCCSLLGACHDWTLNFTVLSGICLNTHLFFPIIQQTRSHRLKNPTHFITPFILGKPRNPCHQNFWGTE